MATITIKDVAEHADVSVTTVSRVLNDYVYVADDIRVRVLESIQALGYRPNRAARKLRKNSGDLIGVIIPDIQNPVFQTIVRGVEDAAFQNDLNVMLCNTDDSPEKQKAYLRVMIAEQAAGLIVAPTYSNDSLSLMPPRMAGIPIVILDREIAGFEADTIKVDNVSGAAAATRHLIALGHQRIALIAGTQTISSGRERLRGACDALAEHGIGLDDVLVEYGDFRLESGYELTRKLMRSPEPPDVIFAMSYLMAMGAIRALHELGIRVPDDVALAGFDDVPWAQDLNPPLSTVAQPAYEIGQEAIKMILKRIARPEAPYHKVIFQPNLVVRESCGAQLAQPHHR